MKLSGRVIIGFVLLLAAPGVFAASRVGTCGVSDPLEGFVVHQVPMGFREISAISESGVQLMGMGTGTMNSAGGMLPAGFGGVIEKIRIYPMRFEYPELFGLPTRQLFRTFLIAKGARWSEESIGDKRMIVMTSVNGDLRTTLAAWGGGRGIVIQSHKTDRIDGVVNEFINSIELGRGIRGW